MSHYHFYNNIRRATCAVSPETLENGVEDFRKYSPPVQPRINSIIIENGCWGGEGSNEPGSLQGSLILSTTANSGK